MSPRFKHGIRTREFFVHLLESLSAEQLNKIPEGFNNNIIWNCIHCITTQQGLTYGLAGLPQNVSKELAVQYKNGTTPEVFVTSAEIEDVKEKLIPLMQQTAVDYKNGMFKSFKEYTTGTGYRLENIEDALSLVHIHEGIHLGYVLALRKAIT